MAEQLIDDKGRTTLNYDDYKNKALIIKNNFAGKNWWTEVRRQLGIGYWKRNGVMTEFKMQSVGGGDIGRKPIEQAKASKKQSGNKRSIGLSKANKLIGSILAKAGKNKASGIMALGASRNADHKLEVQTFAPALEQLDLELESGAITKAEYKKRLAVIKSYKPGDHPDNIQNLHWSKNQEKMKVVEAKNKALKNMEMKNPSLRNQTPKMAGLMSSILNSKKKANNLSGIKAVIQNNKNYNTNFSGNRRGVSIKMDSPNVWHDPLLMTPPIRLLDKSIDVSL
mgnify:CR=1 FL=1